MCNPWARISVRGVLYPFDCVLIVSLTYIAVSIRPSITAFIFVVVSYRNNLATTASETPTASLSVYAASRYFQYPESVSLGSQRVIPRTSLILGPRIYSVFSEERLSFRISAEVTSFKLGRWHFDAWPWSCLCGYGRYAFLQFWF